jgi:hypothetical protein
MRDASQALPRNIYECYVLLVSWEELAVLPIVSIPLVVQEFCSQFAGVFTRREQKESFEALIAGLSMSENRTIAGIHQRLLEGPTYERLHHFMTDSPWSVKKLAEWRLQYVKKQIPSLLKKSGFSAGISSKKTGMELVHCQDDKPIVPVSETRKELQHLSTGAPDLPVVTTLDATFIHHTGEDIYGVYWYWDYANKKYTLAQRLVLSTLVTPAKQIPLGWRLFHRGFLDEQKLYLESVQPAPDADQAAWGEYNGLVEKYEQNEREHIKQHDLAAELVDENERLGLEIDAYVCDAALAVPELMDRIDGYNKAWVSRMAKNRLVQTEHANGGFESIESFAKSLPKEVFAPVDVQTRHGQKRKYYCFSKCLMVRGWKKLRIVISYDNEELEGEPVYLITNKKQWTQPQKIVQVYMMRDPIEHLIRDAKQEVGFEDCQQRNENGVRKHWEISFAAYTFLELGFEVPILPGVPAVRLETIGQRSRVMEGAFLYGFINHIKQWVLEGKDTKEIIGQIMTKRLNRLAI